mmetsp:Transcript_45428/g.120474  ORF Transcript_45428/g.120474 Transcript_45428/m.120474 type:complete len:263 (-) Transcript_45428:61-849(-)
MVAVVGLLTEGCRIISLCPFDVHFSQTRIRLEFQDGRLVNDTFEEIVLAPAHDTDDDTHSPGGMEDNAASKPLELQAPFPAIEVTKWRCKLREPNGAPRLDPVSGLELYSHEERWFTFDNRRLYCLQRAATKFWPQKVCCDVIEVPPSIARTRELRKFDTRSFGLHVLVGRRDDPQPDMWSWRAAVGLPEQEPPQEGIARQKSKRWSSRPGQQSGRRNPKSAKQEEAWTGLELMRSALLFVIVYLGLRIVLTVFRRHFQSHG